MLSGQINGLSSLRSITLQLNDNTIDTRSFINAAPTEPNEGVRPVPFSFGSVPVGSQYNITIKDQPDYKTCTVVNGQGVITLGVRPDVVINCTHTGTRYSISVHIPTNPALFAGLQGAKVRVTTEEEIREVSVTPSTPTPIVFNNVLLTAPGALNAATYSVQASTFEGNTLNKCVVTLPSGSNPTGNVTTPVVGAVPLAPGGLTTTSVNAVAPACQFSVGGSIGYSLPPGATTIPAITGLRLQLRDMQQNALETLTVASCTPANGNVTTSTATTTLGATVPVPAATCPFTFTTPLRSSTSSGLYEVAVLEHPVGQFCIVTNGGSVSVFTQGLVSPVSVTNANVFCRARPPAGGRLSGCVQTEEHDLRLQCPSPVLLR